MGTEKLTLFKENFESYSIGYDLINEVDWVYYETAGTVGTGIIQSGQVLELKKVSGGLSFWSYVYEGGDSSTWSNYEIDFDITQIGYSGLVGFVGCKIWLNLYFNGGTNTYWSNLDDGSKTAPAAATYTPCPAVNLGTATAPTHCRIVVSDTGYSVYYNNSSTATHEDITPDETSGTIGVSSATTDGFKIDNFHVYQVVDNDYTNNEYFKRNLLNVSSSIEFQKNLGDTLDTAQDITKYVTNVSDINEKLTKSSTNTGGVLLPSMKIKLDNSRGVWNKQGDKFKNGFINNSLVSITTNYLDDYGDAITPAFTFEGIMKYSSSSWDRNNFLFETTLTNPSAVIASEKIQPGILSNNTLKNIVFKILNRQPFTKYMTIDINNFSFGWDVTATDSITDMVNKKVKDVLDDIMLLTGSVYYVNYDQEFIIEPVVEVSPSAVATLRGEDIFKIISEGFYWKGQFTSIVWNDDTNPVQRVEMNYTDRTLYQYDFTELELNHKYITDTTNRNTILNNLLNIYKFLKRQVKLECKWNPEIKINDYISLDIPEEAIKSDNLFIWNENQWNDNKYWGINQPGISFNSDELWRVVELKRDTLGDKMQLTLVQLYSDDEI